jgi:predicted lipoprotein with Yx(FWY)xxD motif
VPDGSKGVYVVWEDRRQGDKSAIRLQHLDAKGKRRFDPSFEIAPSSSRQTRPLAVSDKAGGIIVLWQDDRNPLSLQDIYGQRISKNGEVLWGKSGKPIISANGDQVEANIIEDGSGGAFLTWTDYRRGERNPDIYAQRINAKGDPLWFSDGIVVCGAPDIQRSPRLIADGEGGLLVSWTDKGGGSYDIYAQRVNENGQALWINDGVPISQFSRTQQEARFGNRKIMVWEDYRYGNWDIFAGAVGPDGKLLWPEEGVPVVTAPLTQYAPEVIPWKDGSVIIAWEDYRGGNYYELYLQKLNSKGEIEWIHNGFKNRSLDGGRNPKLISSPGDNSFYLLWEDYTYGDKAIYGQKYLVNN